MRRSSYLGEEFEFFCGERGRPGEILLLFFLSCLLGARNFEFFAASMFSFRLVGLIYACSAAGVRSNTVRADGSPVGLITWSRFGDE